ncbi:hypothetical protein GH733_016380 [Mirounga leonina]|nr:hypothetical protein GH733_016380 [Mirounga leonina]
MGPGRLLLLLERRWPPLLLLAPPEGERLREPHPRPSRLGRPVCSAGPAPRPKCCARGEARPAAWASSGPGVGQAGRTQRAECRGQGLFCRDGTPGSQSVAEKFEVTWETVLVSSHGAVVVKCDGRGSGFQGTKLLHEVGRRLGSLEEKDQMEAVR